MIANEYDPVFKDGDLTQLMIIEKNGKAQQPKRLEYPIYKLLKSFLEIYGINMGNAVMIGDYQVRAVTIDTNFDVANEIVLQQLYSFTAGKVNIQLSLETEEQGAFAFNYDVTDHTCTFEKYVFGSTQESTEYASITEMMVALKAREAKS